MAACAVGHMAPACCLSRGYYPEEVCNSCALDVALCWLFLCGARFPIGNRNGGAKHFPFTTWSCL
eukprot:2039340-Alexandrium_andersonii.AAC.1